LDAADRDLLQTVMAYITGMRKRTGRAAGICHGASLT